VASGDPQVIARKLRLSLRISLPRSASRGSLALSRCAHLALSFFGASYASAATIPLWLLALGYLPTIPKVHYIAVCRATGHIQRAALVLTLTATLEVAAAVAGALAGGLDGLSLALLAALMVEGLVTTPRVVRAARVSWPAPAPGQPGTAPCCTSGRRSASERQAVRAALTAAPQKTMALPEDGMGWTRTRTEGGGPAPPLAGARVSVVIPTAGLVPPSGTR